MYTPQEIDQIAFGRATFGGYDIPSVDKVLGPLTEDYVTLYKENALLKSKMRVLVAKLEEYRSNEASMKDAMVNAQKTCDRMVRDAEEKCTRMLQEASSAATENAKNSDALIAAEKERVEEARRVAAGQIGELTDQLNSCIQALERIRSANAPAPRKPAPVFDFDSHPDGEGDSAEAVAEEISTSLEALVGTTDDVPAPAAEPKHPASDTTGKFTNLQFGRNYDPTHH